MMIKPLNVLALMSGTSIDAIKYALISTDGVDIYREYLTGSIPFPEFLRTKIELISGKNINNPDDKVLIETVENDVTKMMRDIISEVIGSNTQKIDLIGIEGPTITHDAKASYTYQLGKGQVIFDTFKIPVVSHFHNADIANGGQGAPLTATYYHALAQHLEKPALFINIGGVSSLTYIGSLGEMLAFDCGPANAMLNHFMKKHAHVAMDYNGQRAALGQVHTKIVNGLMKHEFFEMLPPKALDLNAFKDKEEHFEGLSIEDGAATIVDFIAVSIQKAVQTLLPSKPESVMICGGGALNPTLVRNLKQKLKADGINAFVSHDEVKPNDASAFAFLTARRFYHLPITFPSTTGVSAPMTGGKLYDKEEEK
ncbi:MAG: anhydro-N-acetylmuramic acid kinase [Alphaproteobacteria bacterium]|nr:anhydro-N-acetylmuramic acid kinase [Alphaproteobacteria bacterium]